MTRSKRPRPSFRLCALAAMSTGLLLAAIVVSGTALAGGGNSANAKKCQKNGWQTLVTSTGATFASEEECTSYGAQGGVIFPSSAVPCLNGGWQAPAQRGNGTPFSSQADCVAYTSNGGVVYKPSLIADPSEVVEDEEIAVIASGFHPNSSGTLSIQVLPIVGIPSELFVVTDGSGGFTASNVFTSGACALGDTGATYTYTDVAGVHASASATLVCP
jgi:hypothetical protein